MLKVLNKLCRPAYLYFVVSMFILCFLFIQNLGSGTLYCVGSYQCQVPSKAAVIMLAKVLSQEFGPDGVRVNTVSPGMVRTGMTEMVYDNNAIANARDGLVPIGRVALPEDMADVVAFLLSPDARYINGHDLVVDGGLAGNHLGRLPGLSEITRG